LELPWPPTANHYTGYRVAGKKDKSFVQAYPTAPGDSSRKPSLNWSPGINKPEMKRALDRALLE